MHEEKELTDRQKMHLQADDLFRSQVWEENRLMINGVSWSKLWDYCTEHGLVTSGDIYKTVYEHKTRE